jgi:plasmid stabilization system protein ParE
MTQYKLEISFKADKKILEIARYTKSQWGNKKAEEYVGILRSSFIDLTRFPNKGKPADKIGLGYRAEALYILQNSR